MTSRWLGSLLFTSLFVFGCSGDEFSQTGGTDAGTGGSGGTGGTGGTGGAAGSGGCGGGEKDCGGVCVDKLDPMYGCKDDACEPCHMPGVQDYFCEGEKCEIAACAQGFEDCDGQPGTGCEANLAEPATCGSCNNSCTATQVCDPPDCVPTCPKDECFGSCVDLDTDMNHCGACGVPCTIPVGGSADCDGGVCVKTCPNYQTVCDDVCVQVGGEIEHCYGCNQPCFPEPNATILACTGGTCSYACDSGYDNCDGTGCISLKDDPDNCGWCGHHCIDAQCSNGLCVPRVYANGFGRPTDIAVDDGEYVYWSVAGTGSDGAIVRADKPGGTGTDIVNGRPIVNTVALDSNFVYWGENNHIVKLSLTDGGAVPNAFIVAATPVDLAVDNTRVYWADHGDQAVVSAPKATGDVFLIASTTGQYPVSPRPVTAAGHVYFGTQNSNSTDQSWVARTQLSSENVNILHYSNDPIGQLATNGTTIFLTKPTSGAVYSMPVGGGTLTPLASQLPDVRPIEVRGDVVVWATDISSGGIIQVLRPGQPVHTIAAGQQNVCALALDGAFVYWVNCNMSGVAKRAAY